MNKQSITYKDLLEKYKKNKEPIPYNELLQTEEWKLKRKEILKRDSHVCQICKKRATEEFNVNKIKAILGTNNIKQEWKIAGKNRTKTEKIESGHYWYIPESGFKKFDAYIGYKYIKTLNGWILIKAEREFKLHIHHNKYILNILPWENYNKDYLTICSYCHLEIHKTEDIKCFKLLNDKLIPAKMTPCYRCHGKGKFPQYEHVENGICFRCYGKRFEELIEEIDK